MQTLAETLPEYAVLRSMAGVGDRLGPLILAEIGDIRRFHSGKALNAYAGNDAPPYQSGTFESHNRHISKRGNAIKDIVVEIKLIMNNSVNNEFFFAVSSLTFANSRTP